MSKITAVLGNSQKLDGGAMFGNAPRTMWSKWLAPDELGRIPLECRTLLIEHKGKRWLLETGIGAFFEPELALRYGVMDPENHRLLENLDALNLKETDIDYVILSHLHFDHAGGLLPSYKERATSGDRLLFPRAKYVVSRKALDRAKTPHARDKASFIPELVRLLLDSKRLLVIDGETIPDEDFQDFRFYFTDGHTPGHMHTLFSAGKQAVFFCGDLIPGTAWIHVPITMGYDRYPELVIDEKKAMLDRAIKENWILFFTHDVNVAFAKIKLDEKGKYLPLPDLRLETSLNF